MGTEVEVCQLCLSCRKSKKSECVCENVKKLEENLVEYLDFKVNSSDHVCELVSLTRPAS